MDSAEDGKRLRALADKCGVKLEYTIMKYKDKWPEVDRSRPSLLFAHSTLNVESAWIYTFILDTSRIDKIVGWRAVNVLAMQWVAGSNDRWDGVCPHGCPWAQTRCCACVCLGWCRSS